MSQLKQVNHNIKKVLPNLTLPSSIHLIQRHLVEFYPTKSSDELYRHVHFRANTSLSFPKTEIADIRFVERNKEIEVEVELNFLGLFGASTPLPIHYAEEVRDDYGYDGNLIDFINLFNHHLQKFIYPIWKNSRYYVSYQKDLKDKYSKYLLSILGLYPQSQERDAELDFHKLLPFLGMLNLKQKSSGTLASIMRHYVGHNAIGIEECVVSKAVVPEWQKKKLGDSDAILGESLICGDFVTVSNLKFRINFYDVPWAYLEEYSLFGAKIEALKDLISFTLNEPLGFELALHIKKENIQSFKMDNDSAFRLGINTWAGEADGVTTIVIEP